MKISSDIHLLFIKKITGLSQEQLFLNAPDLSKNQKWLYDTYLKRYNSWEPLEYIIESAEFYGYHFFVDSRVLIPRNDTEIMVEKAVLSIQGSSCRNVTYIDIGTGSGYIPISVVKNIWGKISQSCAIDISESALKVADINRKTYHLQNTLTLYHGNLLDPIIPLLDKEGLGVVKSIIITANLPYIKQDDFENMDTPVYIHEPRIALYGWENTGFEMYEELINQAKELSDFGHQVTLFIEIGFDQKQVCETHLWKLWYEYEIFQDMGWVDRCVKIELK